MGECFLNAAVRGYAMPRVVDELTKHIRWGVFVGLVTFLTIPVVAREPAESVNDDAQEEVTLATVEARLAAIEEDPGIDDAVKDLLRPKYRQAIDLLKEADEIEASAVEYRQAIEEAPELSEQFREELQALPTVQQTADVTPPETMESLQQEIETRKAALQRMNEELSQVSSELSRVKGRPLEISDRLTEAQRELSDVNARLASPEFSDDVTSPGRVADRILLQARQSKLQDELEMLKQEQASQSAREMMLQAQQELLARQVENAEAAIESLDNLYQDRLTREAKHISLLADAIPKNLPEDDAAVQSLASEVQGWASQFEEVVTSLTNVAAAQELSTTRLNELTREYEDIQAQVELGSGGRALTQYLLDVRRRLPDSSDSMAVRRLKLPRIGETRLRALEIEDALRKQEDVKNRLADHASDAVAQLVEMRRDVLEKLGTQYRNLIRAQAALQAKQQQYMSQVDEVRTYISQQLFWMQSSPPIGLATFTEIPAGLSWALKGEHWAEMGQALQRTLVGAPARCTGFGLALAALLIMRRRIAVALRQTGTRLRRISTDRYARTFEALLWTLLLAIPVPLLLGFAAWALQQTFNPSDWVRGIRYGLEVAAWCALGFGFLAEVCRTGGLGAVHFGWRKDILPQLRRSIIWMAVIYIPALVLTVSCILGEASQYFDSVGRISFILAHIWLAIVLWYLFRSSHGVLTVLVREHPTRRLARWRHVWFPLLLAAPLGLALLAIAGYVIAAFNLSLEFLATAVLVSGGGVLYCFILRWFTIKQRRLALTEAIARRRARREAGAPDQQQDESSEIVSVEPEDEEELDLEAVSEQTKHVLRLLVSLLVAVAMVVLWSGTIPLIQFLDTVQVPLVGGLTLLTLCQALLALAVTGVLVHDLPGLLELAALRATTINPGTRIAISTLAQYAVIAIGITVALNLLNVDWAAFGWIAAALSVGIGFGLQEVVANFVCGLILLFERPIRVGDIVTVEGTTGTVTRIHMRATTIINWDRQEFVVPNKNLITSTILNWTLNTTTNRVTIAVGVAYGSDTERARQILLDVAAEHSNVLDDPAPLASFEEFGDSTLVLRLRAYIPDMENYLRTTSELHTEIDKRFAAAGIEIAFPQRDLHLRSGWEGIRRAEVQTLADRG